MKKRLTALILAGCMMILTACTGADPANGSETADPSAVNQPDDGGMQPDIPKELRYDGRSFRVLATPDAYYGPVINEEFELENNADVLGQALYNRLLAVENRFGITMELNYGVEHEILSASRASINSQSDDYDLVVDVADRHTAGIYEGLYLPVNELPYIDLEKPWWNKAYIESVSINPANPYILFGAINHNGLQRSICTFFNMDLLEERKGMTAQDMYDLVIDGGWTLDKLIEFSADMYNDENGNTAADMGDLFGFVTNGLYQVELIAYSSGLKFTDRDENGYPVLALNNERTILLADKLLKLFVNNPSTYRNLDNTAHITLFGEGRAAFLVNRFFIAEWGQLRDSDVNYGIIPAPKLDESVENYCTAIASNTQWQMVPITEPDPKFASAIIEYLSYYGYEHVVPAYYDITLKFKYTRGDLDGASKMLDLIVDSAYTDFMYVNDLGGMQSIFRQVVDAGQNNFSSKYAEQEMVAKNRLKGYIEALG